MVEAEFAVIAFLINLGKILWCQFREITFVIINTVKQRGERRTEVEAAATAVANIKNP